MSYKKHTWETGETITAEKLNNLENGIASSGGVVKTQVNYDESKDYYYIEETYNDIVSILNSGEMVYFIYMFDENLTRIDYIDKYGFYNNKYVISLTHYLFDQQPLILIRDSADTSMYQPRQETEADK